jgi:LysM repeat protein
MRSIARVLSVAASATVPLLLVSACSGDGTADGSGTNLTPITGSSYVTILPVTTTTTTTVAPGAGGGPEPGTVSEQEQIYVVQANDGPAKIANLYGITMEQLFNYNEYPEGDQHVFLVGEEVRIPPGAQVPATGGTPAATTVPPTGGETETTAPPGTTGEGECPTTYVIQSGDTSRIRVAERFGITFEQMDAANANTPGYQNFVVGTPITIPCP